MAENIGLKFRCVGVDKAAVIATEAAIATAVWTPMPLTLRDDELSIVEEDPTESEIFSHENDDAEDYDISGNGMTATGSFIKATYEQAAELLGGTTTGTGDTAVLLKSSKKVLINNAFRFRLASGGAIIIPNGKGYVNLSVNLGANDGLLKLPFKIKALAQSGFTSSLVMQSKATVDAAGAQGFAAPMATAATVETTETTEVTDAKAKTSK